MSSSLHKMRIQAVLSLLTSGGVRSVLDLGCGSGALLAELIRCAQFTKIAGIDTSLRNLTTCRCLLEEHLNSCGKRLLIQHGSFTKTDKLFFGFDAAVMLETLEHVKPCELSKVERTVFGCYRPKLVLITTPNIEYNPCYGWPKGKLRRSDHHFEWSRDKFHSWAGGVAGRHRYTVRVSGIGPCYMNLGAPTQLAAFYQADEDEDASGIPVLK